MDLLVLVISRQHYEPQFYNLHSLFLCLYTPLYFCYSIFPYSFTKRQAMLHVFPAAHIPFIHRYTVFNASLVFSRLWFYFLSSLLKGKQITFKNEYFGLIHFFALLLWGCNTVNLMGEVHREVNFTEFFAFNMAANFSSKETGYTKLFIN